VCVLYHETVEPPTVFELQVEPSCFDKAILSTANM
jgi:hypothetical protein